MKNTIEQLEKMMIRTKRDCDQQNEKYRCHLCMDGCRPVTVEIGGVTYEVCDRCKKTIDESRPTARKFAWEYTADKIDQLKKKKQNLENKVFDLEIKINTLIAKGQDQIKRYAERGF